MPSRFLNEQVMGTIVFFYFASVIVVTAALVVALRSPVYSALALLVMFFHVAGLFVTLQAEFLERHRVVPELIAHPAAVGVDMALLARDRIFGREARQGQTGDGEDDQDWGD